VNAAFWDETYRSRAQVWSGDPNPHVVSEVSALAPGHALDAGSGEGDDAIFRRLAAAVAPGGVLLIVGHHPSDLQTSVRRPPLPEVLYAPDQVTALLEPAAWDIAISTARERSAVDREGRTVPVHDTVVFARRRTP
jgi:hypothetical protein